MPHHLRSVAALGTASLLLSLGVATAVPLGATAAPAASGETPSCSAFDDPVYQVVKPKNGASLATPWIREAQNAAKFGFSDNRGTLFTAAGSAGPGLVPVHRLYRWSVQDFLATSDPVEIEAANGGTGYQDQGENFYVSEVAADCLIPVYRYEKGGRHRLAIEAGRAALADDGWTSEGVKFWAGSADGTEPAPQPEPQPEPEPTTPPAPDDGTDKKFSFAVYPDTQQEVGRDTRFINRSEWLVDQQDALDLRFVTHSGDVVNWDTPDHAQYEVASKAMVPLEQADIPYSLAIGNHDTQAVGEGGGVRDSKRTRTLVRDTSTFNDYFNANRYGGMSGAYEQGKVDNVYSLYEAGGVKWMVLVLELWPRPGAVSWAKSVVAAHPEHNVVVVTHDYLDGGGGIEQGAGYGDTSPQQLYDQLISQYANIRMVFSGHVGIAASRQDTGVHGNKISSFMTTFHSGRTNPVRLVEVDTAADSIKTWIYSPWDKTSYPEYNKTVSGVDWVE